MDERKPAARDRGAGGREKILGSATMSRLRYLVGAGICGAVVSVLLAALFGFLWDNLLSVALCAVFALLGGALLLGAALAAAMYLKIRKQADRYAFTVAKSASFECFGPFLAMNVRFFDGTGTPCEGRSRFLFGARDVEAWQNVSLEIAYLPAELVGSAQGAPAPEPTGEGKGEGKKEKNGRGGNKGGRRKKRKPDTGPSAMIVVIGTARIAKDEKDEERAKKSEK